MFLVKQVALKQLLSSRDDTIKMNACMLSCCYFVPYSTEVSRSITSWIKTIFEVNLKNLRDQVYILSAFSKTWHPPELRRVLSCELPAVFLQFPLEEKGPWGLFHQFRRVLAKGRHLLQILLKALYTVYEKCEIK